MILRTSSAAFSVRVMAISFALLFQTHTTRPGRHAGLPKLSSDRLQTGPHTFLLPRQLVHRAEGAQTLHHAGYLVHHKIDLVHGAIPSQAETDAAVNQLFRQSYRFEDVAGL